MSAHPDSPNLNPNPGGAAGASGSADGGRGASTGGNPASANPGVPEAGPTPPAGNLLTDHGAFDFGSPSGNGNVPTGGIAPTNSASLATDPFIANLAAPESPSIPEGFHSTSADDSPYHSPSFADLFLHHEPFDSVPDWFFS